MADTHTFHEDLQVPDGDVLIHAGDLTRAGHISELEEVRDFFSSLPHRHKLVVAGHHDWCFLREPRAARHVLSSVVYLEDEAVEIDGIKFYGSPWQPASRGWAFHLPRGPELAAKWSSIPEDTDVLITHGPPRGIGDLAGFEGPSGCDDLLRRVMEVRPKLHVFGHVHRDRGQWVGHTTHFVNATTAECMAPVTVIDYPPELGFEDETG